jgi:hypothetical protein
MVMLLRKHPIPEIANFISKFRDVVGDDTNAAQREWCGDLK